MADFYSKCLGNAYAYWNEALKNHKVKCEFKPENENFKNFKALIKKSIGTDDLHKKSQCSDDVINQFKDWFETTASETSSFKYVKNNINKYLHVGFCFKGTFYQFYCITDSEGELIVYDCAVALNNSISRNLV